MKRSLSSNALLTAVLCLAVAVPVGLFFQVVLQKHFWAKERLDELAPRHARLLGLQMGAAQLAEAEQRALAQLGSHVYPASQDVSQAGNDAQQRVRSLFSQAGLEVVSSQVLPAKVEKQFDRIPMTLRVEGDLMGLQSALLVMSSQSPSILVDSLGIQTFGVVKADAPQKLVGQLTLSVLRARP